MAHALSVGAAVRVAWQEAARRATVACVLDDGRVEVLFDDDESEAVVEAPCVSPLEAFEADPAACPCGGEDETLWAEAGRRREEGNALFKLRDAAAAAERYAAAIAGLGAMPDRSGQALAALNRTIWAGRAEAGGFVFRQPVGGRLDTVRERPAARAVPRGRLLRVQEGEPGGLQVTLYLNRARCWLSLGAPARAVQDCELALALRRCAAGDAGLEARMRLHWLAMHALVVLLALATGLALAGRGAAATGAMGMALAAALAAWAPGALPGPGRGKAAEPKDPRLCTALFLRARARLAQGRLKLAEADAAASEAAAEDILNIMYHYKLSYIIS